MLLSGVARSAPFVVFDFSRPYLSGDTAISYDKVLFDTRNGPGEQAYGVDTRLNGRAGGRGYVWRPWFSELSADLDLNLQQRALRSGGGSDSYNWDGIATLLFELVPRSHVPFSVEAMYSRDDTQNERVRLDLEQRIDNFKPWLPDYQFGYEFDESSRKQSESVSRSHRGFADIHGDFRDHRYSARLNGLLTGSRNPEVFSDTESYALVADHSHGWSESVVVSEFLSGYDSRTKSSVSSLKAYGMQGNVVAQWQPSGNWSGNVSASAREDNSAVLAEYSDLPTGVAGSRFRSSDYSVSGALQYRPDLHWRAGLTLDYRAQLQDGVRGEQATESLDASYSPDSIDVWEGVYRWNASGRLSSQQSSQGDATSGSLTAGHNYVQRWGGANSSWSFTVAQNLGQRFLEKDRFQSAVDLSQRAGISWRGVEAAYSDYILVQFSDQRQLFGVRTNSQAIDFAFNRKGGLGEFSDWAVDLNYQLVREVDENGVAETDNALSSRGDVSMLFSRANVFSIYNLMFRSTLNAQLNYDKDDDTVLRDSHWENSLEYRLGRLSAELSLDISESDEGASGTVLFEVRRRWDSR